MDLSPTRALTLDFVRRDIMTGSWTVSSGTVTKGSPNSDAAMRQSV